MDHEGGGVAAGPPLLNLVLAVSLDGRLAPPAGGAAQLGGRGDRRALEEALAWAAGCLIGAETLRRHGSTCLIRHPDLLERRGLRGLGPQPVAVVVSRTGRWATELPFFTQPLPRWWLQGQSPSGDLPPQAPGFERCLPLRSWPEAITALAQAGLQRLVLLGGACLAQELLAEALVDELQLTLVPRLLGGAHSWVPPGSGPLPGGDWQLLEQRDLGEGELLLRYRRGPG
ncbi:MAG: RibD family protein [Cyanobacteriota bacterium]